MYYAAMVESDNYHQSPEVISKLKVTTAQLEQMSLPQISDFFDGVLVRFWKKYPNASVLESYRYMASAIPIRIPNNLQTETLSAMVDTDKDRTTLGKKVGLFLRMHTILSATEPYFIGNLDIDDEIVQSAVCNVWEGLDRLNSTLPPSMQIHTFAKRGAAHRLAEELGGATRWFLKKPQVIKQIIDEAEEIVRERELSQKEITGLTILLSTITGCEPPAMERLTKARFQSKVIYSSRDPVPEQVNKGILSKKLEQALNTLTEREHKVIKLRFGSAGETGKTLEEVGEEFHVVRERIRQIEAKALRKLRSPRSPLFPYQYDF